MALLSIAAQQALEVAFADAQAAREVGDAIRAADTPGKNWYVDSVTGNDSNSGTNWETPFATIAKAISVVEANRRDKIFLLPTHTQNLADATTFVQSKVGVEILGIGWGANRPTFVYTNTAGKVVISAACRLSNLIFRASVSAVVLGVDPGADDIQIDNCRWDYDETGDDFVTMLDIDAIDRMKVYGNEFIAEDTAGCAEAIRLDDCDDVSIIYNHFYGDFTDGAIVGEGAAGLNLLLAHNTIYNSDTTAGFLYDINVAFTGIAAHNACGTLFATAPETAIDPGSLLSIENYVCNAVDESGALVPTTVST